MGGEGGWFVHLQRCHVADAAVVSDSRAAEAGWINAPAARFRSEKFVRTLLSGAALRSTLLPAAQLQASYHRQELPDTPVAEATNDPAATVSACISACRELTLSVRCAKTRYMYILSGPILARAWAPKFTRKWMLVGVLFVWVWQNRRIVDQTVWTPGLVYSFLILSQWCCQKEF